VRKRKAPTPSETVFKPKRTCEKLKDSEKKFQALLNLMPDLVAIVDEKGKILAVNDAAEKLGGYKKKELVGKNFLSTNVFTPESKAITAENLAKRMTGAQIAPYEVEMLTKYGETKSAELNATKIEYKGKKANLVVFRDITERKKAEKELRESEEKYKTLMDDAPISVSNVDLKGTVTFVNKRFEEVSGYSRGEVVGKNGFELGMFDDETLKSFAERMKAILEGKATHPLDTRFKCKDGKWLWVEIEGRAIKERGLPVGFQLISRDITERRKMEEALKQSEAKLKALHSHARTLAVANTIEEVAKHSLDAMEFTLGFDVADFCGVENGEIHVYGSKGAQVSPLRWPLDGPGVVVKSVKAKGTLRIPDTREEPSFVDRRGFSGTQELRPMLSELAVPVLTDGEAVAVLNVESSRLNAFTDEDKELLETLAMHVASALGRLKQVASLERLVEQRAGELKVSEAKYRLLVENVMDVVFVIDLKGNFTFCSQAAEKMTGYSVGQLLSMNMEELIAPEYFPEIQERLEARIRGERYLPPHEFEIVRADGKRLPIEMTTALMLEKGTLTGIQGVARDVGERRKAEEVLRESEEKFRRIYNASLDAIYTTSVEGEILDMNPAGVSMFGFDSFDELRKVNFKSLYVNPDDRTRLIELAHKGPVRKLDVLLRRKDGAIINGIINTYLIKDKEGEVARLQGAIIDITELRQMEKKLREAERLAAIGETTAMVSHDLRNPLQAVTGAIYLAKMKYENLIPVHKELAQKSGMTEVLTTIDEQVKYMNKIVSDLQDYASPVQPQLAENSLRHLIDNTISTITVPETVKVSVDVEKNFPNMKIDPALMRRVFTNLVTNALQAMPDGGQLTIKASKTDDAVAISFRDTGVGIAEENFDKLFMPLFTTKSKGQGFGLPVCKRLVEAHGGTITVKTKLGEGSTFTVKLPLRNAYSKEQEKEKER